LSADNAAPEVSAAATMAASVKQRDELKIVPPV
jgi:hypothetical protein